MGQLANLKDDVYIMYRGDSLNVYAGPELRRTGWRGGLWVRYIDPGTGVDDFLVEVSDGNEVAGFMIFPSENYSEVWGSVNNFTGGQLRTGAEGASTVAIFAGGGRSLFKVFETVALAGGTRSGGPITYSLNEDLKVSENGLLCNDSNVELALAGVTSPQIVGKCSLLPTSARGEYLGLDVKW